MLKRMMGGQSDWEMTHADVPVDVTTFQMQIVDVREPDEWQQARIPGSRHIPLGDLQRRAGELDRNQPVLVVCLSGSRSLHAAKFLASQGFNPVKSLHGGLVEWSRAGRPLER